MRTIFFFSKQREPTYHTSLCKYGFDYCDTHQNVESWVQREVEQSSGPSQRRQGVDSKGNVDEQQAKAGGIESGTCGNKAAP